MSVCLANIIDRYTMTINFSDTLFRYIVKYLKIVKYYSTFYK